MAGTNNEYITSAQVNMNFGETFRMTRKAPAIAKRIFLTKRLANEYIHDALDTAVAGLILSVIGDLPAANGLYQVINDTSATNGLSLKLIGGGDGLNNLDGGTF